MITNLIVVVDIKVLCTAMFYYCFAIVTLLYYFKRFVIYKLPIYKMEVKGSGVDYMYLDPSIMDFQMSKHTINSSKGAVGRTLTQLYSGYTVRSSLNTNYNPHPLLFAVPNNCFKSLLRDTTNLLILSLVLYCIVH